MVTRKLVALAAAVTVSLLAQPAARAEAPAGTPATLAAAGPAVDAGRIRAEIDGYMRALNEQMRTKLSEDLRRELAPKIVVAANEPTTES
jgi:hypothetical protein